MESGSLNFQFICYPRKNLFGRGKKARKKMREKCNSLADPLYEPLLEPCEPAFGRAHDFVLHKFGQQIPPIVEQSLSCKHFGVQVDICEDSGHSPKSIRNSTKIKIISNTSQQKENTLLFEKRE